MMPTRAASVGEPVRVTPAGVIALELWDLELSAGILWDHMHGDALPGALVDAVRRLREGTARTRSRTPIPALTRTLEAVWIAGGRAPAVDPSALARALELPVWRADDPAAVAERGGRALVPDASTPAVVDLGQSSLKVFLGGQRLELPRPWDHLPILRAVAVELAETRAALRAWVAGGLAQATARTALRPDALVFALPCELGDPPIPGSSSYPGLEGDERFVTEVVAAAGWAPARSLVLNDAELAAVAAGLDPRTRGTLTLVLTLGFGVGGALRSS